MSRAVYGELRLVEVLREAQAYMQELKNLHQDALTTWQSIPTAVKNDHKELKALIDKYPKIKSGLKAELTAAHNLVNHLEGRREWSAAVLEVFGEEGLQKCYAVMHKISEQKELSIP